MTISATWIAGLLAVALPALISRRLGPWLVRVVAVAVVGVVGWVLLASPRVDSSERRVPVTVVATGAIPERSGSGPDPATRWVAAHGSLVETLLAQRLRGGGREVALAWTGPFDSGHPSPAADGTDARPALTTTEALRLDPADIAVRLDAPLEIGRPGTVAVAFDNAGDSARGGGRATWPDGVELAVRIHVGDESAPVVERRAAAAELRSGPVELRFVPKARGPYTVQVEVHDTERGQRAAGQVAIEAAAARRIAVVGDGGDELVAALRVQGVAAIAWSGLPAAGEASVGAKAGEARGDEGVTPAAEREAALPVRDEEASVGAVVLLARPDEGEQERLLRFLRAGGGVFVIGGEGGGAMPLPGEPLHGMLPVFFEPTAARPDRSGDGDGPGDGDGRRDARPDQSPPPSTPPNDPPAGGETQPPETQPPETKPPEVEPTEPADPPPDHQPTGDPKEGVRGNTDGAQLREGPEVEVERRQVAMVLVVDRSASMGEQTGIYTKMDLAKRSALETAKALKPGDQLGVISFGRTGVPVVPLADIGTLGDIESELEKLRATDRQTLVRNALEQAQGMLEGSRAAVRHIVVISDGVIYDAGAIDHSAVLRAAEIKKQNITLSAILIGEMPAQTWVPQMTRLGGGKFYHSSDAASLPRFVSVEVASALGRVGRQPVGEAGAESAPGTGGGGESGESGRPGANRPADTERADGPQPPKPQDEPPDANSEQEQPTKRTEPEPERGPATDRPEPDRPNPREEEAAEALPLVVTALVDSLLLAPDTAGEFPPVFGLLDVRGRPDARTLLVAGDDGLPLLAVQNRGLGKIAAWTADLTSTWGAEWRADVHFPARLAQWVTHLLPPRDGDAGDGTDVAWELTPPAPRRAEQQNLQSWAGADPNAGLQPLDERVFEPASRLEVESRPAATPLAPWVLGAIVLLALVEFVVRRRFAV